MKQLQEELDKTRRGWSSDREQFQLRESKLEANLTAARKANAELEVREWGVMDEGFCDGS